MINNRGWTGNTVPLENLCGGILAGIYGKVMGNSGIIVMQCNGYIASGGHDYGP